MPRLTTRDPASLQPATCQQLEAVNTGGRIADVYLQLANSETALQAYLGMEAGVREGSLSEREVESIKLLVSELTQCGFCLSTHSVKARRAGLPEADQLAIRRGTALGDERLDTLLAICRRLFTTPGALDDSLLQRARDAGISDTSLVDLCLVMSTIFFTNISNHINDPELLFPPAKKA